MNSYPDPKNIHPEITNLKRYIKSELDLKIVEFYYKEIVPTKKSKLLSSPLAPILLSAFFAIVGTVFGAWLQGRSNLELERQKYESSLVLKMVETDSKIEAIRNLEFILNLGLIKNEELKRRITVAITDSTIKNIIIMTDQLKEQFENINSILSKDFGLKKIDTSRQQIFKNQIDSTFKIHIKK